MSGKKKKNPPPHPERGDEVVEQQSGAKVSSADFGTGVNVFAQAFLLLQMRSDKMAL